MVIPSIKRRWVDGDENGNCEKYVGGNQNEYYSKKDVIENTANESDGAFNEQENPRRK